jgi:hypothetical protein
MATYKEKRGTNVVPIVSAVPSTGVNGEIVYITGQGLASYNDGTWSKLTANAPVTHPILGTSFGILAGGSTSGNTMIQKYSFTSDGNATDTGADLATEKKEAGSAQTLAVGYAIGGNSGTARSINAYTFANSSTNAVVTGVQTKATSGNMSDQSFASSYSETHMYAHGSRTGTYNNGYPTSGNKQNHKTSFASSSGTMSYVGTTLTFAYGGAGGNSDTHGYTDTGINWSGTTTQYLNDIGRHAFASDENAVAFSNNTNGNGNGDNVYCPYHAGYADSREKHYLFSTHVGMGSFGNNGMNFSHASGGTATVVTGLCTASSGMACTISTTHIYLSGGSKGTGNEKIAIANDTTAASSVGVILHASAGQDKHKSHWSL